MLRALIGFEAIRRLKMISTYVYGAILFAAGFFLMLAAGGAFSAIATQGGNERVHANSPQQLFGNISLVALFGIFTVAAIFGQAAYQDFGYGTWMIIFTKNVKKRPYLIGRFLGAFVYSSLLFGAIGAGMLVGSVVIWKMHPENLGPTMITAYLWPYLVEVWPMLFFTGSLFFTLAAVTRKMAPVYVGAVVLVLGYVVATAVLGDVANRPLASMLDPFGFIAFGTTTRYWTPVEQNRDLVPLVSIFGLNRLVWTGAGFGLLALAIARFRTTIEEQRGAKSSEETSVADAGPTPVVAANASLFGWIRSCAFLTRAYVGEILRSPVYWSLIVAGVLLGSVIVFVSKEIFGTATLPVTYHVLELATAGFRLFTVIIVIFYAGELVWRERDVGIQDVLDATRAPSWVGYIAKVLALFGVAFSIKCVVALVALFAQVGRGYFGIQPKLYFTELVVISLTGTMITCVLAVVVQVLVNHKYIGHAVMVLYYVSSAILGMVGVEDPLWRFNSEPSTLYSDMNGYGHFLGPWSWFRIYWGGLSLVLLAIGYLAYVRGRESKLKTRFRLGLRTRLGPGTIAVAAVGFGAFILGGGTIFWNTHVLNRYESAKDNERGQAEYEKKYKAEQDKPQLSIVAFDGTVDLFPSARRAVVKGTYRLKNKTEQPIARVMVNLHEEPSWKVRIGDTTKPVVDDPKLNVKIFELPAAVPPGGETDLAFEMDLAPHGFRHKDELGTTVVENGTFMNNFVFPIVGYFERAELVSDRDRKSYDLPPKERMAKRDDPKEIRHNYIRQDADFIKFGITVSTDPDQIAVAPGYLQREWSENGRRYFRYDMDAPILAFFSVLSARYEVKKDKWNDVNLEIYYDKQHTADLDRMMLGLKDSLTYCSEAFGPYQHKQARILEFPRYQTFAQSFPNTIPYSEAVGFIARVRDDDPDDVDYPYYVTAHEIAHQWWAHQVVGANVRGATMTSESMAQYSALMVMKHKYGPEKMRRFLKFELDSYLRGRFVEQKKELPLAQNENQQYIHYNKGSVAMYALQDYIGEDKVNLALRNVVDKWRFQGPPYATAKDLVDAFREQTPPELAYLIDDLFETITLYDNRAKSATMKHVGSGDAWEVTLQYSSKKLRSDEKGDQKEVDFEDRIDVGALDANGTALFTEKRPIKKGDGTVTFTVPAKPSKVGIDPLNKLIDKDSSDNVTVPSE